MSAWVYRVFDADGRLIYVGATENLGGRLDQHRNKWWAHQASRVSAKVFPTLAEALTVERAAIVAENPRWNTKGRWRGRHLWQRQDYCDYVFARRLSNTSWVNQHLKTVEREFLARFGEPLPQVLAPSGCAA